MTWKKLTTSEMYQFEEDVALEGTLVGKEEGRDGRSAIYTIQTKENGEVRFWGCAVLDSKLAAIEPATLVRITYLGKAKGKSGREYKDFDVEVFVDYDK